MDSVFNGTVVSTKLLTALPIIFLYDPLIEAVFPNLRGTIHFYTLFVAMFILLLLSYFRILTIQRKIAWVTTLPALSFLFTLILTLRAFLFTTLSRSCWSFTMISGCLYLLSCVNLIDSKVQLKKLVKTLNFHLISANLLYCTIYLFFRDRIEIFGGVLGLIIPLTTFSIIVSYVERNSILAFISILSTFLAAKNHYQSSYWIIVVSILIALVGARFPFYRNLYLICASTYCILIGTTNLFFYLLSISSKNGYDNIVLRELFARVAFSNYKQHIIFGGLFENPVNVTVLNAGKIVTLPLHNDALVYLVASGLTGWILFNLALLSILMRNWDLNANCYNLGFASAIISLQLCGIFSSLFGSSIFNLICSLSFIHAISNYKNEEVNV